jgi:acyl carrier protein/lysophospholipase L1-like esterase
MTWRLWAAILTLSLLCAATPAKKKKKRSPPAPPISAAARQAARTEIEARMAAVETGIENPAALAAFLASLQAGDPVHILQFGDSHTASDDWANAIRTAAQARFGDGGPGFVQAGHPYRGYRRFDASGANSPLWKTEGTMALRGDPNQGLSGISISTVAAGQTVTLSASGEALDIFYLQQPGGGQVELTIDGQSAGIFSTDGDLGPGQSEYALTPGPHQFSLRSLNFAPVRLFGWALDNKQGVTVETLGINGAQANVILGWNQAIFSSELTERNPALVILAYGTNEANSHSWTAEQYRADLLAIIDRIRRATPAASILMIGPPDCGRLRPLLHLSEVIDIQREIARRQNVAFWDWRLHMGGPGIVKRWVVAGLSQTDYIHLTPDGYRLIGKMVFEQLLMSKQEKITEIVKRISKKKIAPGPDESLFDTGYLDSFALTDMVMELEQEFGLTIPDADLSPRRFESVARIEHYLDTRAN